jgi:hypothetical protein
VSVLASGEASLKRVPAVLGRLPRTEDMFDVRNTDLDIKPLTVEAENRKHGRQDANIGLAAAYDQGFDAMLGEKPSSLPPPKAELTMRSITLAGGTNPRNSGTSSIRSGFSRSRVTVLHFL